MAEVHVPIKPVLMPFLLDGSKDLEVRPASQPWQGIRINDVLIFVGRVKKKIVAIRSYDTPTAMLNNEDGNRIWPGKGKNLRDFLPFHYRQVIVFELKDLE
jgi:ASC-1-like (ASCH) protein